MSKRYSDRDIAAFKAFYETHGAVRLPGFVEPAWTEKILALIDKTVAKLLAEDNPGPSRAYGLATGRITLRSLWRDNKIVREFLLRPELADPVARIIGAQELRFWFDLTFIHDGAPDGAGVGTDWHHDISAFSFKGEQLPSLWMALTETNAQRSRLQFIDGSHRSAPGFYRTPGVPLPPAGESDGYLDIPDFTALVARGEENILTWDCEPGDAIILHPYVVHGASGNLGNRNAGRRVAITTRWFGDDVRYLPAPDQLQYPVAGLETKTLPFGAKPRGDTFPLVWSLNEMAAPVK